jgi:hypothetical protein
MNVLGRLLDQSSGPPKTGPNGSGILNRFRLGFLVLAPIVVVAVLVAFLPPDGNERAE